MQPRRNPPTQAEKNKQRLRNQRDLKMNMKQQQIDGMSNQQILAQLKAKGLPVFGTSKQKADRLKKAYGIQITDQPAKRGNVVNNIQAIQKAREQRRRKMQEEKIAKQELKAQNEAMGKHVDIQFQNMISQYKSQVPPQQGHVPSNELKISVNIRKRPIFKKEQTGGDIDAVSITNPYILIHQPKLRVDGITKYLQNHTYTFDNTFGQNDDTQTVYNYVLRPVCPFIMNGGTLTCFAYGQTGSGKTYTMKGLQSLVVQDLFNMSNGQAHFIVSFYQIYGGRCSDLLNQKAKLTILQDGAGNIQVHGLREIQVNSVQEVHNLIAYGNSVRTTHRTTSNQDSSRSHAICQMCIVKNKAVLGKLRLVDLAGSEKAQDCMSNNRQRRIEGAEINKSLLALKECIRALRRGPQEYVPYRGSKLTLILRDSFEGRSDKKVIMITCVSPGHSSSDHTLNSLRYSDRLKEQSQSNVVNQFQPKMDYKKPAGKQVPPQPIPQPAPTPAAKPQQPKPVSKGPVQVNQKAPDCQQKFRKSFRDMQYIQERSQEEKVSREMLDLHEKVETILEEEEELLQTHVNAIKEDAQILTEEGELIAMAQGEGELDYDIDTYVARMEVLVKHKLTVYQHLYQKIVTFKRHLTEEEEVSHHLSQNISARR